MEKKLIADLEPEIQDAYRKAVRMADETARMQALLDVVKAAPEFPEARRRLRDLERKKIMAMNFFSRLMARGGLPKARIKELIEENPLEAMKLCEDALFKTLDNQPALKLLAEAAEKAEMSFVAAEAMSRVVELSPNNFANVTELVRLMQDSGEADDAVRLLQSYQIQNPGDKNITAEYHKAIKTANRLRDKSKSGAVVAIGAGTSNAAGSKSAAILQLLENTIHDAAQAKLVATELRKILQKGESMDVRKKLASAYVIMGDFDRAIEELEKVIKANSAYDPSLDKSLEAAEIGRIDKELSSLKRRPPSGIDAPARIAELEAMKLQLKLDHANSRIEHYPNDVMLRYELGQVHLLRNEVDEAMSDFNLSMAHSRCEIISRYALAECHRRKGEYNEAIAHLEHVLATLPRLDRERPPCAYALAKIMEATGENERALELYKDIYSIEPRFRDVGARIKAMSPEEPQPAAGDSPAEDTGEEKAGE